MHYIKLKLKDKSAQDMIEFTFVLPLLIFCFVFILTGGQLIYNKFVAFNAVYNGLRAASVEPTLNIAKKRLEKVANEHMAQTISVKTAKVDIDIEDNSKRWIKNNKITGEVTYIVNTVFPFNFTFGDTEFLAPNQLKVSALSSAFVEYNTTNTYTGDRIDK